MDDEKINDGGPVYPIITDQDPNGTVYSEGMTLRDYFAGQALNALVSKLPVVDNKGEYGHQIEDGKLQEFRESVSISAYDYSDAMIKAKSK